MHDTKEMKIVVKDEVLIKVEEKTKRKRSIRTVEELLNGKVDIIRDVKLQTPKSHIE